MLPVWSAIQPGDGSPPVNTLLTITGTATLNPGTAVTTAAC
jgi:hypothetical protein